MKQQDDVILSPTNSNELTTHKKRYHKLISMRTSEVFAQLELKLPHSENADDSRK